MVLRVTDSPEELMATRELLMKEMATLVSYLQVVGVGLFKAAANLPVHT